MRNSVKKWHQQYVTQTRWTRAIASYLFPKFNLPESRLALEVGCGTGAALQEILQPHHLRCFGVDINDEYLSFARQYLSEPRLIQADAHRLPIASHSFDLSFCHFLLLWVSEPVAVLAEMVRVTRHGGIVLALAEPDHGSRIDFPPELSIIGKWQFKSLRQQGADPTLGRQLRALFSKSGLIDAEAGILGGEWSSKSELSDFESEWQVLQSDLTHDIDKSSQLTTLKKIDSNARQSGERILFVPTFYAWGRVP